jgi:hypothetical protein
LQGSTKITMKNKSLKALAVSIVSLAIFTATICPGYAVEQAETEKLIRHMIPPVSVVKEAPPERDEMYVDSYYEPSDILQGNKTGHWSEITNTFGYKHRNITGYASLSRYERFDNKDFTFNVGTYISLLNSFLHMESGLGWYTDYMYNFQETIEYGHKLYKTLYWQMGYAFRGYKETGNSHIVYPGLIYYFGDSYLSANYGAGYIEARDTASFGSVKGDFAITKFLRFNAGAAFGERLYDIFGLDARKENGYILFTGLNWNIYKGLSARAGYSYSEEAPKFVKRSLNFGLSLKF